MNTHISPVRENMSCTLFAQQFKRHGCASCCEAACSAHTAIFVLLSQAEQQARLEAQLELNRQKKKVTSLEAEIQQQRGAMNQVSIVPGVSPSISSTVHPSRADTQHTLTTTAACCHNGPGKAYSQQTMHVLCRP